MNRYQVFIRWQEVQWGQEMVCGGDKATLSECIMMNRNVSGEVSVSNKDDFLTFKGFYWSESNYPLRCWSSCWPCAPSQVCARCCATWSSGPSDPDSELDSGRDQDRTGVWFWCSGSAHLWMKRAPSGPCSCWTSCWRFASFIHLFCCFFSFSLILSDLRTKTSFLKRFSAKCNQETLFLL